MNNRVVSVEIKTCGYGINLFDVEISEIVSATRVETYNIVGGSPLELSAEHTERRTRYVAEGVSHEEAVATAKTYKRIADMETDYLEAADK